jgi:hypothetical protein
MIAEQKKRLGRGNHHRVNSDGIQIMNDEFKGRLTSFGVGHKRGKSGSNDGFLKVTLEENTENSVRENNYDDSQQSPMVDEQEPNEVDQGVSEIMKSINKLDDLEAADTLNEPSMVEIDDHYHSMHISSSFPIDQPHLFKATFDSERPQMFTTQQESHHAMTSQQSAQSKPNLNIKSHPISSTFDNKDRRLKLDTGQRRKWLA